VKPRAFRGDFWPALLYMAPALVLCLAFVFIPFVRAVWLSFFVVDRNSFEPSAFYGLNYYGRIFNLGDAALGDDWLRSILATLAFALMVVPASLVAALGLAYLATAPVRRIGLFRTLFSTSVAVSVASASVIWSLIFSPNTRLFTWLLELLGSQATGVLTDSRLALPAVAFMTVWSGLGFNFIIALAGLQAVPHELLESARIDGASRRQSFRHVTLPLLGPTLLFLLIITTITSFQAFTQFKVMIDSAGPDRSTNVFVYSIFTAFWSENNYGFASAMSVVLFFILLGLSWLQFRLDRTVHYQ
jgi:ABC-type sugar transport system permease subunit